MSDSGVGAQVYAAAWLSRTCGLEVQSFGRSATAPKHSCLLEMTGRHLAYSILLDGGWVFLSASLMDKADPPEFLFSMADGLEGWQTTCRVIAAMERSGLKSLERPFHVGSDEGPGAFEFA